MATGSGGGGPRRSLEARLERRMISRPPRPTAAAGFIAGVSLAISVIAGIVVHWVDDSIDTVWLGLYWAVQTVTTVGYGDEVPTGTTGQAIAIVLMLVGTAFIAVVTAAVTSVFIERARALHERAAAAHDPARATLEEIRERLERIETRLGASGSD